MAILTSVYDVESNIETTLYSSISPTATTGIVLNTVLTITKGVLSFETNGVLEYVSFGGAVVASGRTTLSDVRRNLTTTLNDFSAISATGLQHVAGITIVKLVNYHALYNLKAGTAQANTFSANQTISGTNKLFFNDTDTWIYDNGTDLRFRSSAQAEVSLSQLAAAAGVNDKVKVSIADTTEGHLGSKLTAGAGLAKVITDPAGNEVLDFSVDLTDTNVFTATPSAGKAALYDVDGNLPTLGFATSSVAAEAIAAGQAVAYDGLGKLVLADGDATSPFGLFTGIATTSGNIGDTINFSPAGIVTVPAFTVADRANCRLWSGISQASSNTTTDAIDAITKWRSQSFVPATGQDNVGQVQLYLTNSALVGTAVAEIYAVSGTNPNAVPTGAALGTSANVTTFSTGLNEFNFTVPIAVTPGTEYAIVFKLSVRTSGSISWDYQNSDVLATGNSGTSANSGVAWTAETTYDRRFTVYYRGLVGEPVYLSDTAGSLSLSPGTYLERVGSVFSSTKVLLEKNSKIVYGTLTGNMPNVTAPGTTTVLTTVSLGGRPRAIFLQINATCSLVTDTSYEPEFNFFGMWSPGGSTVGLAAVGETDSAGALSATTLIEVHSRTVPTVVRNNAAKNASLSIVVDSVTANSIIFSRVSQTSDYNLTGGTYNIKFIAFLD